MVDLTEGLDYPPDLEAQYVQAGHWTDETPQHWLARWAEKKPEAPAVIGPDRALTYRELHDSALQAANGLLAAGFRKGDVIGVQLPNIPEFLILYHGIQMMGGVIALLHMPYRSGELEPLLAHGGVRGMVCFGGLPNYDAAGTMFDLKERVPSLEKIVVVDGEAPPGAVPYAEIAKGELRDIADPPAASDPAVLAYTSGTAASPKAVVHAYRTMACSHRNLSGDCGLGPDDVVLSAPPLTHIYGLCVSNITLHVGAANALMAMYTPDAFAQTVENAKATVTFCGPAHMLACLKAGFLTADVAASLRRVVLAGSACPPELVVATEKACPKATAYQMWGMTEVLMSFINPTDAPLDVRLRSIGTPPAAHEIRAVGEDGRVVEPGEEGELEIRGPFLFAGYFNNDEANEGAFDPDGWYRTGDLATIDKDGNVAMTGRVKDIINRGGIKINPIDVEGLMDEHDSVVQSAIVPMPDEILGEKACLFVVLKPDASLSLEDVQHYLDAKNVAKMKWPERVEVVDEMPMTPTRKIIKGKLAEALGAAK